MNPHGVILSERSESKDLLRAIGCATRRDPSTSLRSAQDDTLCLKLLFFLLMTCILVLPVRGQARAGLYVGVLETRGFITGAANPRSGLFHLRDDTLWTHLGWTNIRTFGLASGEDGTLYMAAGNGLLRSVDGGQAWRITTGWEITEVLDVAVESSQRLYIATAHGVWRSDDAGETWRALERGLPQPGARYAQVVAVDRQGGGYVLVGAEEGLFRSEDGGEHWQAVGPEGVAVRSLAQHPTDGQRWLAGTEASGVFLSEDGGQTWRAAAGPLAEATIYAVAFDLADPVRMVAAGHQTGLFSSIDGGLTWTQAASSQPIPNIHALAFDPRMPGRLWIGTLGMGVFRTDDLGQTWISAGLEGAVVRDLMFYGF